VQVLVKTMWQFADRIVNPRAWTAGIRLYFNAFCRHRIAYAKTES
jgi:hypothetical protein